MSVSTNKTSRSSRSSPSINELGLFLAFRLRQALLHSQLHNPPDQLIGNRLIQRELQISLRPRINRDRLLNRLISRYRWKKPDVFPEGGEVNQNAVLPERR